MIYMLTIDILVVTQGLLFFYAFLLSAMVITRTGHNKQQHLHVNLTTFNSNIFNF